MSRFQAMTNAVLDRELDELREQMGLRESQKAELLRELATMASWLMTQARAGRRIEARGPSGVEVFRHPALEPAQDFVRITLDDEAAARLQAILDEDIQPSDALRATLQRIADPERQAPPTLRWPLS